MDKNDLERIVNEYCDGLREQLLKNIEHFESDWNGLHVRALAGIITDIKNDHPGVQRAAKAIKKSMTYYKLSL